MKAPDIGWLLRPQDRDNMQRFVVGPAVAFGPDDDDVGKVHLKEAKLDLLQLVTAQLTSETRWLRAGRTAVEEELGRVLKELGTSGRAAAAPDCSPIFEELVAHAGGAMPDEAMAATRKPMTAEALEFVMDEMRGYPPFDDYADVPKATKDKFHVVLCGAGVCGLAVAVRLKLAGIPFTLLEKSDAAGGTRHDNRYPNVGCDTPSHAYSYSFEPNYEWRHYFAKGAENKAYFERVADKYGVRPLYGREVQTATFDDESGLWTVACQNTGETFEANVFISCVGMLSCPKVPALENGTTFKGAQWHTARWRDDVPLEGKNVAVIGTGASCMQVGPWLASVASRVTIFQSTPQWFMDIPNYKREIPAGERWCFVLLQS